MKRRKRNSKAPSSAREGASLIGEDEAALFRDAVRDVEPLTASGKVLFAASHPRPIPLQIQPEQTSLSDTLSDHISLQMESGEEWAFLRPGVSRQTLRRLRRGYWKIQAELDLHGFNRDKARLALVGFLDASVTHGYRCVRVIHGKGHGSRNHEPILKTRIGSWLSQRNDVLAFCQARPEGGGSGAVLVLLRSAAAEAEK